MKPSIYHILSYEYCVFMAAPPTPEFLPPNSSNLKATNHFSLDLTYNTGFSSLPGLASVPISCICCGLDLAAHARLIPFSFSQAWICIQEKCHWLNVIYLTFLFPKKMAKKPNIHRGQKIEAKFHPQNLLLMTSSATALIPHISLLQLSIFYGYPCCPFLSESLIYILPS